MGVRRSGLPSRLLASGVFRSLESFDGNGRSHPSLPVTVPLDQISIPYSEQILSVYQLALKILTSETGDEYGQQMS